MLALTCEITEPSELALSSIGALGDQVGVAHRHRGGEVGHRDEGVHRRARQRAPRLEGDRLMRLRRG